MDPRDVEVLIADAIGKPVSYVVAHGELEIDPAGVVAELDRRWAGEPLQYIRQRADFFGREFFVDDRVLIPRPETELLVETALKLAPHGGSVIDIGAGSGAIAVTIERERPDLRVLAVDVSIGALAVTKINCRRHGARLQLAASDIFSSIRERFDLILSNPPYIPSGDIAVLQVEVRGHEPRLALTPGDKGTEVIDRLISESIPHLTHGGHLVFEIGVGQGAVVREVAEAEGWTVDKIVDDLAGIPRTVVLSRHGD